MTYEPIVQEGVFLRTHLYTKSLAHIWFLHGFGESSLSFEEAFFSELVESYSLFVPDLPGFGVSPPQPERMSLEGATEETQDFIVKYDIPNRQYAGAGHWPMIETPDECYSAISRFFGTVLAQNII